MERKRKRQTAPATKRRSGSAHQAPKSSELRVGDASYLGPEVYSRGHSCLRNTVRSAASQGEATKPGATSLLRLQARLPNPPGPSSTEARTERVIDAEVARRANELRASELSKRFAQLFQ